MAFQFFMEYFGLSMVVFVFLGYFRGVVIVLFFKSDLKV